MITLAGRCYARVIAAADGHRSGGAQALRRCGIDVTTTVDADLMTAADPAQLGYAAHADRVIVTHDRDFLAMANSGEAHAGIAYCHIIYECLTPDEMQNRVEYL